MFPPFPDTVKIEVPSGLANDLLKAAESLPRYENQDFYSPDLQQHICDQVRASSPDGFDWLTAKVREKIAERPYCALVVGLRFDDGNKLFVAINRAFGELVARPYEKPRAQLVHYIQPSTDIPSSRGGQESERLHTDTADWETPVELISMRCVRADRGGGGRSRILDIDSVRDEVKNRFDSDLLGLLSNEPVPWQLATYRGGGIQWRPVLTEQHICWRRYTIDQALDSKLAQLPQNVLAALDAFDVVVSKTERTIEFLMREDELLFSDNTRTIHARTPITEGDSDRLMIRSWVRTH